MVLVLVIGDSHIPLRAAAIPEAFRQLFTPDRIQAVFITGNMCSVNTLNYYRTLASEVYVTRGNYDQDAGFDKCPEQVKVELEGVRIGMVHGHQVVPLGDKESLGVVQREMDVDLLISGATHVAKVHEFGGKLFVNPGSITGAFRGATDDIVPSFVLLDVKGKQVTVFTYTYVEEEEGANAEAPAPESEDHDRRLRI
ncbi:vacuolar sorting protein, partial [Strigomonas culicis]